MKKLTAEKCREQFEEWVTKGKSEMHREVMLRRLEFSDGYFHTVTRVSWEAWKAALEIALLTLEQQERGEGDWIQWNGEMALPPVDSHVRVEVRRRNGGVNQRKAQAFAWRNQPVKSGTDIIAYRIIPEQPTNQNGEQ